MLGGYLSDIPRFDTPPVVPTVTRAEVREGYWIRHWHYPRPVSPLYADFEFGSHLFLSEEVAAREFAAILARQPDRHARGGRFLVVDGYIYREQARHLTPSSPEALTSHVVYAAAPEGTPDGYEWAVLRRWPTETRPAIVAALTEFRAAPLATLSDDALLAHIRALSDHLTVGWALYFTIDEAARVVRQRCQRFCHDRFGMDEPAFLQLLVGASPASSAPITRMEELAAEAFRTPHLRAALDQPDPWSDAAVRALLEPYLEEYGQRATDWEYITATLAERPQRAVQLLRDAGARLVDGQPRAGEVARRERDVTIASLLTRLADEPARATFDRLLHDAQDTFNIHEDNINLYTLGSGYMRYALLEAGARLAARGRLSERERVFFLRRPELEAALSGRPAPALRDAAEQRWTQYQEQLTAEPPRAIGTPPSQAAHPGARADDGQAAPGPKQVRGLGASPGMYTGAARVIVGEDQFEQVQPGEVLVCPQTSPTWTMLFGRIGALITDDGGILSHSAIAAREFGIPAVLATRDGTRTIHTGQIVQVDGGAGTVSILPPSPAPTT